MKDVRSFIKHNHERIHQGDIYSNVTIVQSITQNGDEISVEERLLPYGIVVSQECDLEQDVSSRDTDTKDHDKHLPTILLLPAYPAEMLRVGSHLDSYDQKMQNFNSERFKQVKQNSNNRYHFIHSDNHFYVPELIIDFKHFFSIARDVAYSSSFANGYIATIAQLFRENLSLRFCHYLSRIGLPETIAE
jgi:hypothetical protein